MGFALNSRSATTVAHVMLTHRPTGREPSVVMKSAAVSQEQRVAGFQAPLLPLSCTRKTATS